MLLLLLIGNRRRLRLVKLASVRWWATDEIYDTSDSRPPVVFMSQMDTAMSCNCCQEQNYDLCPICVCVCKFEHARWRKQFVADDQSTKPAISGQQRATASCTRIVTYASVVQVARLQYVLMTFGKQLTTTSAAAEQVTSALHSRESREREGPTINLAVARATFSRVASAHLSLAKLQGTKTDSGRMVSDMRWKICMCLCVHNPTPPPLQLRGSSWGRLPV